MDGGRIGLAPPALHSKLDAPQHPCSAPGLAELLECNTRSSKRILRAFVASFSIRGDKCAVRHA
jgi:hypothetical protein